MTGRHEQREHEHQRLSTDDDEPMARLVPEPTPLVTTSGIMPATNAIVVIKIGRRRSWLASRIASWASMPCRAQVVGVIDLQDRVLLHDAEQHEQPSAENMLSDWSKMSSEISAKGSVSGSESRIVIGWSHDSNCAARTRYMKMNESAERPCRNALAVRLSSRERPV